MSGQGCCRVQRAEFSKISYKGLLLQMEPRRQADRGLGRRVSEIVEQHSGTEPGAGPRALLGGPAVVPFEVVPLAMLVADNHASVVAVNSRWCAWSGLEPEDSLGSGWTLALSDDERSSVTDELRKLAEAISEGQGVSEGLGVSEGMREVSSRTVAGPGRRWWLAPFESAGQVLIGIVVAEEGGNTPVENAQRESDPGLATATENDGESWTGAPGLLDGMDAVIGVLARLATNIRDS